MKKIILLFIMLLTLNGCSKTTPDGIVKEFSKKVDKSSSYKITGTMEISNDEETFTYNLESFYMKDDYYKVILVNKSNNHEQVILKSNGEVYVITPELNKSFKFQSEWPDNSSQSYLLGSIINDLESDESIKLIEKDNNYVIKSKVNYVNNKELTSQKVYFDKNMNLLKVEVLDSNDLVKIKVEFDKIDLKANLTEDDFDISEYIDNYEDINCDNSECNNKEESDTPSSYTLDSIIYPLYVPNDTNLTHEETIKTTDGNRVILTFTGVKNFVLIEESAKSEETMKIVPVYGDPLILPNTIGALTSNSVTWDANNVTYYLASSDLSKEEMLTIANSLGNTTQVSKEK